MSQRLRSRIQTRLAALGINPFEADRRAGLARGYVNDLLIGKKASMRPAALGKLADALDCDPDYLNGVLATPRPGQTPAGTGVAIEGIIEPGVWREPGASVLIPATPPTGNTGSSFAATSRRRLGFSMRPTWRRSRASRRGRARWP